MSEVKLKPCPFCGSEDLEIEYSCLGLRGKRFADVACVECGVTMHGDCDEEAIQHWNRRYTEKPSRISENAPNSGENNSGE